MESPKLTPMMRQYLDVRRKLPPNTLLLFRLGDFYEMFDGDAEEGARLLGITLTKRNGQLMAGIPYHAADTYIQKVLKQGVKVAICEQMENPVAGKIVKRELTRILTPGTTLEDHQVDARENHYLLAIIYLNADKGPFKSQIAASWLDLTTGEFRIACEGRPSEIFPVLSALDPKEILVPEWGTQHWTPSQADKTSASSSASGSSDCENTSAAGEALAEFSRAWQQFRNNRPLTTLPDYHFDADEGLRRVKETLGVLSLEGFGIAADHPALGAAGALIQYATETLCARPANLISLRAYRSTESLLLDPATLRNLEIFKTSTQSRQGSLLAAMDNTVTAPGARLLEQFLAAPSLDLEELQRRQSCVGAFLASPAHASELQDALKPVRDIPRILGRLQNRLRNPRELGGIRETLQQLPLVRELLAFFDHPTLRALSAEVRDFPELRELLSRCLADSLPNNLQEGGTLRTGFDPELDRLRDLGKNSKRWIAQFEASERQRTGIKNLRIKFNGAFGYFIEITKSNLGQVPDNYIRRQTMVNAERFTLPELKAKEQEILHADERALARELELFADILSAVLEQAEDLRRTADALARIDVFLGWSQIARRWDYCEPLLDHSGELEIEAGRHPVVEQMLRKGTGALSSSEEAFVPNDCHLSTGEEQICILTGPNMAGKSTYIRQVALITLMAQVGSWVPARTCRIGLVDRIFSRVGASDELARGNSTFMVEMNETANILNNATERSLIILDEIGRGTSTYDGLAIAWAVVEHLHGSNGPDESAAPEPVQNPPATPPQKLPNLPARQPSPFAQAGPRTLFATHYHELTQIEKQLPRIRNYSVAVKEWGDRIIFVREVHPGAADRSYGIQVARLAGLPPSLIRRAQTILAKLEADDSSHNLLRQRLRKIKQAEAQGNEAQLELF